MRPSVQRWMSGPLSAVRLALWIIPLLLVAAPASAFTIRYVGPLGGYCQYTTIQAAIDAADSGDAILISTGTYNEFLEIKDKNLNIFGGETVPCGTLAGLTIVDASGHSGHSVLNIQGASNVQLYTLELTGGSASGQGGGVAYLGHGTLDMGSVTIDNNTALYGGGIGVSPNGPTQVHVGANTLIIGNTANGDGGGINIDGGARLDMVEANTTIYYNHAPNGRGGGINVTAPASANIASSGYGPFAAIQLNDAKDGGGIAVFVRDDDQGWFLNLFSIDPASPLRIADNFASDRGGGIWANGWTPSDFDILGHPGFPYISGFGVHLDHNGAPNGAAIYGDDSSDLQYAVGPEFVFTQDGLTTGLPADLLPLVSDCALDAPCNTFDGNQTYDHLGNPTDGTIVNVQVYGFFGAERFAMRHNSGGNLLYASTGADRLSSTVTAQLNNCLIVDNTVTGNLIDAQNLSVLDCTLAYNSIGVGNFALAPVGETFVLHRSIVFTPGRVPASQFSGDFAYVMVDNDTFFAGPGITQVPDPLFINPAQGDYHLQPHSPAVDAAICNGCVTVDLDGRNRGVKLFRAATPFDVGAYELQYSDGIFKDSFQTP